LVPQTIEGANAGELGTLSVISHRAFTREVRGPIDNQALQTGQFQVRSKYRMWYPEAQDTEIFMFSKHQGEGKDLVIEVGNVVLGRVIRLSSKQVWLHPSRSRSSRPSTVLNGCYAVALQQANVEIISVEDVALR
jgi:exosome complex RNA-binding protein Csl4